MDKQKQIDEMAKDIYWCKSCDTSFEENCGLLAQELYNANYRKIPENAAVLTEERNKIICDRLEQLERVQVELQELNAKYYNEAKDLRRELKRVRKETAEKFAIEIKAYIYDNDGLVEKVDEIAKEITGW